MKIRGRILCAVFILLLAASCAASKTVSQVDASAGSFVPARHLVFIGLDGWGGAYVSKADMPTVKRMMAQGASSLHARCVMPSNSWPNWTALFYGALPEHIDSDGFPSIFSVVAGSAGPGAAALFYEWGELLKICPDETAEKLRIVSDPESARKIAAYIAEKKPVFTAVVFNEPDSTGHNKRWGSKAYYAKLAELDGLIAIIEQAVKDSGLYDSTVFVLSSDHGGTFWGHGYNIPRQRRIPLVIYGGGIKKGTIPSPASIIDIAPTMAAILGLQAPREWTGQILPEVFR